MVCKLGVAKVVLILIVVIVGAVEMVTVVVGFCVVSSVIG